MPTTWDKALQAVLSGLKAAESIAGVLSGRNTNEEAFLFAKLVKMIRAESSLEVFYQERELSSVQKILMSPDRSPNFRGARDMGVADGGFESLLEKIVAGNFAAAYIVGDDLINAGGRADRVCAALGKLSFLVVQDTRLSESAKLAHVVLPATHFGEKEGTYTNRQGRLQKVNAALIAPDGALQDSEIFIRLLDLAGARNGFRTPADIFVALAREIPAYSGLNYDSIGDLGIELGSGGGGTS